MIKDKHPLSNSADVFVIGNCVFPIVKNNFDFIAMQENPREVWKTHMALESVFSSVFLICNYCQGVSETLCSIPVLSNDGMKLSFAVSPFWIKAFLMPKERA